MKYLKSFEAEKNFNVGDIVVFKDVRFASGIKSNGEWNWQTSKLIGKISEYNKLTSTYAILIETSKNENYRRVVPKSKIVRLANIKELEEYNLNINTNKYNL